MNADYAYALIAAHVPEAEYLTFGEAFDLAVERNHRAAEEFAASAEQENIEPEPPPPPTEYHYPWML
jgi:hypothetical protein